MRKVRNANYYLAALVALATFIVYRAALQNEFVSWDDSTYILNNLHIRSFNTALFKWAFFDFDAANWHPLTWISHALDYAIWGLNPLGHHLTNIILHAVNTFVVVLLSARLLDIFKKRTTQNSQSTLLNEWAIPIAAGVTGLLFGLHPVHVESVAWVAERKDLLCALFFLLSIMMYTNYVRSVNNGTDNKNLSSHFFNKRYLFTLGLFVLALSSKPMAVSLPVVLLMLDWYPFNRIESFKTFRSALVEKLPFIALSIVSSILTILAQRAGGALSSIDILPLSTRLPVAAASLIAYLWKMLWPLNLVPYYPYPKDVSLFSLEYLAAIALVTGITLASIVIVKKQKIWLSAWGYYVITLLPVLGIVQVGGQSMADRYTYLPGLGPFFIMGLAAAWITGKVNVSKKWGPTLKVFGSAAAIVLPVFLSYVTVQQISIWKNSIELWSYVIEKDPERICIAYNSRGVAFDKIGQLERALQDYDKAIALNAFYPEAYNNRGVTLKKIGMFQQAIEDFDKAIALNPDYYKAYNNRASAFGKIGQFERALMDYERAVALNPSFYEAYVNLGVLYGQVGSIDKAITSFNRSLAIYPENAEAYYNRGFAYSLMNQDARALDDFNVAIKLNQGFAQAYFNRGKLYVKTGRKELAAADFQKACGLGYEAGCNAGH